MISLILTPISVYSMGAKTYEVATCWTQDRWNNLALILETKTNSKGNIKLREKDWLALFKLFKTNSQKEKQSINQAIVCLNQEQWKSLFYLISVRNDLK